MPQPKPDLTLSLADIPVARKVTLNLADVDAGKLTLMDALDIAEVSGVPAHKFASTLAGASENVRAKLLYAYAWVIVRKIERSVTWEEMQTYDLEVIGSPPSDEQKNITEMRARATMNVVRATGLPPSEAEQLTVAQVAAVMPSRRRKRA